MRTFPFGLNFLAGLICFLSALPAVAEFDLVIRGGRVIDGFGNPAVHADLAIREGRVVEVGRIIGAARETIDATGLVVAPGFIDAHTHADDIHETPLAENFARMGVTTAIVGNCGSSEIDFPKYFARLHATNVSLNVASLIGHGSVREKVMGSAQRAPTASELAAMETLVDQAMREGALGISTGLIYLPGVFAETEELVALAKVAARYRGIYATHMRDEAGGIFEALNETFRIAREAGLRAHVSHIKCSGKPNWGRAGQVISAIECARASGLDITQDQYVYTASSTTLGQLIPEETRAANKLRESLQNPAAKQRLVAAIKEKLARNQRDDFTYVTIAEYKRNPLLNGLDLPAAARKQRGAATLDDQVEMILELQSKGGASAVFHGISEEDVRTFLRHPFTMIASDSSVRNFGSGMPHPRGYGNNARLLARYVREQGWLTLEDAVRRMTGLPASVFQLRDRGCIRPGAWADLVVFDPARVQDQSRFSDPHHYATGFKRVLVNGRTVVHDDQHTAARPGRILRLNAD